MSYNLHTHSLLSDGALLPSEVAVRYLSAGYKVIAITDHCDYSNIDTVITGIRNFTRRWPKKFPIKVISGIELTHLPPQQFVPLAKYARHEGIKIIVAHGQTLAEPVVQGTNRAALEADIDILAHPGLISDSDVRLANEKKIFLEITSRKGHSATNRHVAKQALKFKAPLILNTDSHEPQDIITPRQLMDVARKAGLGPKEINRILKDVFSYIGEKEGS